MPIAYSFVRMPDKAKTLRLIASVSLCVLAVLLIALFPRPFGVGHYWTVHRSVHRTVSQTDWHTVMVPWITAEFSTLLLPSVNPPLRSTDLHTFTCTLNC
jgi:hypothetical protein